MIKITPKPKKLPKFPRNYKMTKILLEPLICLKYHRNIQNTLNLYFGNLRCFKCILVILHVYGYFGNNLGFRGFYQSFFCFFRVQGYFGHFLSFGVFRSFFRFQSILVIFLGFRGISVIFYVLEVFR